MTRQRTALQGLNYCGLSDQTADWPGWVPVATRDYLAHVERGLTLRQIAEQGDVHPSTILRRIRRVEVSREDPLLDSALRRIARPGGPETEENCEEAIVRGALVVLRKMADPEAVLAMSRDLEKGAVMRSGPDGEPQRLAVVDKPLAEEMTVRGWIACFTPEARVQRYRITAQGRALLRRAGGARPGLAEEPAPFTGPDDDRNEDARRRVYRFAAAESPLSALSRRRDGKGIPFLPRDLVAAGDRLREDFLVAQRETDSPDEWEAFLERMPTTPSGRSDPDQESAQHRVERALTELGPDLADVALRACCFLEGFEQIEKRLGWSARSGKIVLKIALERLRQHYRALDARDG